MRRPFMLHPCYGILHQVRIDEVEHLADGLSHRAAVDSVPQEMFLNLVFQQDCHIARLFDIHV
jgi:hypothetical protein